MIKNNKIDFYYVTSRGLVPLMLFLLFSSWIASMTSQVTSDHHGNNETDLEGMLSFHQELRTEIDTMHRNFENLVASGQNLLTGQHYAVEVIQERLEELRAGWAELLRTWEDRTEELQRRKEAENMNREVTQLEAWLLNQEAELSPNEVGNCLENVEDLLKKHDEIERMLLAQEERFLGLIQPLDDEQGYHVTTEDLPKKETDTSAIKNVHDLTSVVSDHISSSDNYDTLGISEPSESNVLPSSDDLTGTTLPSELNSIPKHVIEELVDRSYASEDFLTNNNYESAEIKSESSMPNLANDGLQDDKIDDKVMQSDRLPELDSAASTLMMDEGDDDPESIEDTSAIVDEIPISIDTSPTTENVPDVFIDHDRSETELEIEMETEKVGDRLTGIFDEYHPSTSTKKQNFPKLQDTQHLFKEPIPASQRILGISPLCAGILQRKQETDVSGQRSVAQPWRSYYTVLSEDILQFFKDLDGFKSKWHVSKPMSLVGAFCEEMKESSRQGYIFRVVFRNKSEYLFAAESGEECKLWVVKINSVIKAAARFGSDGNHGDSGAYGVHQGDGDYLHSDDGGDDGAGDYDNGDQVFDDSYGGFDNGSNDGHDSDGDGRNHIDSMKSYDEKLTPNDAKQSHSHASNSDAPMIVITDTNSNDEFLVEDEILNSDTRSFSDEDVELSDGDIVLFDEDTISLPEQSDYELPSWYPTPSSDHNNTDPVPDLQENASTLEKRLSATNSSSPSLPDEDTIAPPGKLATRVFKAQDDNEHGPPPPIPSTPPPSIPVSDMDLPPDLPETLPPPDDDLLEMLDFIPPPILDPSFDFLVETKDEVSVIHAKFQSYCWT